MHSQVVINQSPRANGAVPPPGGATFASFVLFASLAALIAFSYASGEWLSLVGGFGFPSDAAWVRAVFARSIATGQGLSFNPATPVAGVAAPSWILLFGLTASPVGDYVVVAKVLGILSVIFSAFLAWAITFRLLRDWRFAFLAGLLVITSPLLSVGALSGTEGAFAGMLLLAVIYWQGLGWEGVRRQRVFAAVMLGMAALARPELLLLLPLVLLDRWFIAGLHGERGERFVTGIIRSFPEVMGALLITLPYILYNLHVGGVLWQQPDLALRLQPALMWTKVTLVTLWGNHPVLLILSVAGLFVAALAPARMRAEEPSFLPVLVPLVLLLTPGMLWRYANEVNAVNTATYLAPIITILGVAGLFLLYRLLQRLFANARVPVMRFLFGYIIAVAVIGLFAIMQPQHVAAWNNHRESVSRVYDLQVCAGRWAGDHLSADASIAAREVGAIEFFSKKRMIDLGGAINREGIRALRRTGSPDTDLLVYMEKTKPSHLAIRPNDFPYLAQRADILTPLITCQHTNKITNGVTTLMLYETVWPAPSMRAASALTKEHEREP